MTQEELDKLVEKFQQGQVGDPVKRALACEVIRRKRLEEKIADPVDWKDEYKAIALKLAKVGIELSDTKKALDGSTDLLSLRGSEIVNYAEIIDSHRKAMRKALALLTNLPKDQDKPKQAGRILLQELKDSQIAYGLVEDGENG